MNRVDFYMLNPQAKCFLHFPNYDPKIIDLVIGTDDGEEGLELDSMVAARNSDSMPEIDDNDPELLPDTKQLELEMLRAAEAKAATAAAATADTVARAAATAAAASLEMVPPQQSIFKTILYKLSSIFGTARIGDINQPSTYFIDNDLTIDEILIRLCIIAADEADEADEAADAYEHAFHAADDLIKLLSPDPSQLSNLVSHARPLVVPDTAASHINKYVSIASFYACVVAYVCACNLANIEEVEFNDLLHEFNDLLQYNKLDVVSSFAQTNKPHVIQATLKVLSKQRRQSVSSTSPHPLFQVHADVPLSDQQDWIINRSPGEAPHIKRRALQEAHGGFREKHSNNSTSASSRGRRLRRSKRTLKKKNMSRKYCRRPRSRRRPRGSYYSRKITKK